VKIKAEVKETKHVSVDINPVEILTQLKNGWKNSLNVKGEYINEDGVWETWYDTHGSGLYETFDAATEEQIEITKAFATVVDVVRKLKNI
jgi:hypothetical protein